MNITLIRHATLVVSIGDLNLLIDPMLSPARTSPAIPDTPNQRRNPLVELPFDEDDLDALLSKIDAVLVTHTHSDHWDYQARTVMSKKLPIFCQPEDKQRIQKEGFGKVMPIEQVKEWHRLRIHRTSGQHGRGKTGEMMAPVSGYVIIAPNAPVLYIAGDTIWCDEVQQAQEQFQPEIIVVNTGAAQFLTGGPITMNVRDVINVSQAAPDADVIAVHMEAINHCLLSRDELRTAVVEAGAASNIKIPADGETLSF